MCLIDEIWYTCPHASIRHDPCEQDECDEMTISMDKKHPCPLCLTTYGYAGPVILKEEKPALLVALKDGILHPDNELILTASVLQPCEFRREQVALKLQLGRQARTFYPMVDVQEHELLPYVKTTWTASMRANYSRAFSQHNVQKLLRAAYATALGNTDMVSEEERRLLQRITAVTSRFPERNLSLAAAGVCAMYPTQFVKTMRFKDEVEQAAYEQLCIDEAEQSMQAAEALLRLSARDSVITVGQ